MADFSLTTLFVVPVGQTALPSSGSTQDLAAGNVGLFRNDHTVATAGNIAAAPHFYVAQGRQNTYLMGSKKSDKIKSGLNVTEWYKIPGCATAVNQIIDINGWNVKCGEDVTLTLRAFSNYINTLYFNGLTRSVTVKAPCCDCGGDPCDTVDVPALIDAVIVKLTQNAPGINPDNIFLGKFFNFERIGTGATAILRVSGKPLTVYGNPCDVAAFPFEYDRMTFRAFVYKGPATTVDFIVDDSCDHVATATITQTANYPKGTAVEIKQMEKNYYSYQTAYQKHLFRQNGYNALESWVNDGSIYDTYYIKFNELGTTKVWDSKVDEDETVIIAVISGSAYATALNTALVAALGAVTSDLTCITTTSTTSTSSTTTTTTSHA